MLGLGVAMADAMDYLMQIATFGFLGGYLAVCVAAPVYLAAQSRLRAGAVLVAVATVAIIGAVYVMSLIPVPDAPWRYLPYIFAALIVAGMAISRSARGGRPQGAAPGAAGAKPAA
jgi:hypothetical protein